MRCFGNIIMHKDKYQLQEYFKKWNYLVQSDFFHPIIHAVINPIRKGFYWCFNITLSFLL